MNVLLVGSCGCEHAIAWKLAQSKQLGKLYIAPGNAGTAKCGENVAICVSETDKLVEFAKENDIGLVVVGPEEALAAGMIDAFEEARIRAFGPTAGAAELETNKAFAKQLMRSCAISAAEARVFERFSDARTYIASRDEPLVIKAAGPTKGKGVFVCDDPADGILAAEKIMCEKAFGTAGDKIIVEDKLLGKEVSIMAFVDGRNIYILESARVYKRIGDSDTGVNTEGMGAYSPDGAITEAMMEQISREILVPVVDGMNRNGTLYKGLLHAGLMMTAGGPRVLKFGVRFEEPETLALLRRLRSDLLEILLAVCEGRLDEITLEWDSRPAVCVVMASADYPGEYKRGKKITGLKASEGIEDVVIFHMGTAARGEDIVTVDGRVLGVTAVAEQIGDAKKKVYEAVEKISFEGSYWRRDIADKAKKGHKR
ncbi:MAG: phosphoribosylamine--glycine ligase [Planctomycetota bacterium]|jgi:phosphoribosylamine--glycine ligase